MDREQLTALRDAINTVLAWPPAVFDEVVRWLAPNDLARGDPAPAPKNNSETNGARDASAGKSPSNGHDRHPPRFQSVDASYSASRITAPTPRPAKARPANKFNMQTAELRLTEALCDSPGMSIAALSKVTSANRATTRERLQQLASRGAVEKDAEGRWRLAGEKPDPTQPPSA